MCVDRVLNNNKPDGRASWNEHTAKRTRAYATKHDATDIPELRRRRHLGEGAGVVADNNRQAVRNGDEEIIGKVAVISKHLDDADYRHDKESVERKFGKRGRFKT